MRGGSSSPPLPFVRPRFLQEAGSWQECRKSSKCLQNRRSCAGARVRVLLSACSVSTVCRDLAPWSLAGTTGGVPSGRARACVLFWRWERSRRWLSHLGFSAFPSFTCLPLPGRFPRTSYRPFSLSWSQSEGLPFFTLGKTEYFRQHLLESCCSPCTHLWLIRILILTAILRVKYYLKKETKKDCTLRRVHGKVSKVFEPRFLGLRIQGTVLSTALFQEVCPCLYLFIWFFFLMWTILKSLLNLLQYCFCFLFWFFGH